MGEGTARDREPRQAPTCRRRPGKNSLFLFQAHQLNLFIYHLHFHLQLNSFVNFSFPL